MWDEAAQLQAGGIKVNMMLGGAAKGSYERLSGDDASFEAHYVPLLQTLRAHNIDGLDLDIEESVSLDTPLRLLRRLHADFGPDFLLSMAPVASALLPNGPGLSGFNYFDLDAAASEPSRPNGKLVNWYNAQFYNGWGDARSTTWYEGIVTAGWDSSRVVMGVLDNPNDGGSGYVALSNLKSVLSDLAAKYGTSSGFGCAVGWEYWDAGQSEGWSDPYGWVKAVAQAVVNPNSASTQSKRTIIADLPNPESPWPNLIEILTGKGSGFLEANKALNLTNGDLLGASKLLGVVLDLTGGLLDGLLGDGD